MVGNIKLLGMDTPTQAHTSKVAYTTSPTQETGPAGTRFVEVQAIDGDILINYGTSTNFPSSTVGTGAVRIFAGTSRFFQVPLNQGVVGAQPDIPQLYVATESGTSNGSIIWWK